jgi:hypothetical protein
MKGRDNMAKKKKVLVPALNGGLLIDTTSNRMPKPAVRYACERAGNGGRVWRVHKDGSTSWLCDTVLYETAERMVRDAEFNDGK